MANDMRSSPLRMLKARVPDGTERVGVELQNEDADDHYILVSALLGGVGDIDTLPDAGPLQGDEFVPISQGGEDVKTLSQLIADLAAAGGGSIVTGVGLPTLGVDQGWEIDSNPNATSGQYQIQLPVALGGGTTAVLQYTDTSTAVAAAIEVLTGAGTCEPADTYETLTLADGVVGVTFTGPFGVQPLAAYTVVNSTISQSLSVNQITAGTLPTTGTGANGARYVDTSLRLEYVYLTDLADWMLLNIPSQWTIGPNGELTVAPDAPGVTALTLVTQSTHESFDSILVTRKEGVTGEIAELNSGGEFLSESDAPNGIVIGNLRGISIWSANSRPADEFVLGCMAWFEDTPGAPVVHFIARDTDNALFTLDLPMVPA